MDPDEILVVDNNYRIKNPNLEAELKSYSERKLKEAEEKEQKRLEKENIWIDPVLKLIFGKKGRKFKKSTEKLNKEIEKKNEYINMNGKDR